MKKILIVGAGTAGLSLAKDLEAHGHNVAGFIDDNHNKHRKGINKLGTLSEVNEVIKKHNITDVYFSIPTASAKTVRTFINSIKNPKIKISIIPRSFKIISEEEVSIKDLKDVDILHLVGREPVKHDLLAARKALKDRVIIVTGAAGSIGSELVKQLLLLKPKLIVCIDFWESGIFYLQHDIGNQKNVKCYIANIRDEQRIDQIFAEHKPHYVFHAAAYKHVPLMQENSVEAFNNNVRGTLNIINVSIRHGVESFVNVSTDKAVNPVNVMGTTKRIVELLLLKKSMTQSKTKISSVRFGNVLESNGSVVQIFKRQIDAGGPLTVTHKDITRFFMTREEAAQLIIQAGILSNSGEVFVLDMGEPILIYDLAKIMVRLSKRPIEISITGLRAGEKMYEELYFDKNNLLETRHEKIFILKERYQGDFRLFEETVDKILEQTTSYSISNKTLIEELKKMGFKIKK